MQYDFAEIYPIFTILWQNNEPGSAGPINMDGWREIYYKIRTLDDKPSGYYICLNCRWEGCSPMVDMNCLVCDKVDDHPIGLWRFTRRGPKFWGWRLSWMPMYGFRRRN